MQRLRVVFDCMIFLEALMSEKSIAFKLFEYLEDNFFTLYVSKESLDEVKNVLQRPFIKTKNPQITGEYTEKFLNRILQKSLLLNTVPSKFTYPRDPKDEKYINLALEVEVDYLVSRDRDLLDLMTDISVVGKEFRQKSRPLKIVEPIEFLKIIEEKDLAVNP